MCVVYVLVRVQQFNDLCCAVRMIPGTGMVLAAVISPNTCDYFCCFAANAADVGDGALFW